MTPLLILFSALLALLAYPLSILLSTRRLRSIPGPWSTRLTRLWFLNRVRAGHFETDNIALHSRYGRTVRITPDHFSVSGRSAVKTIYGTGSKFTKAAWYDAWRHPDGERGALFSDRNMRTHAETRKSVASLYTMSSLMHYEMFVDRCADIFCERLNEFAARGESLDMGHWFQCYAFDVIGDITFGDRFGFLDRGEDIEGTMAALQRVMTYGSLVGIYPEWHPWLFGPLSRASWSGAGGRAYIMQFVQEKIQSHVAPKSQDREAGQGLATQDFVQKMMLVRDQNPGKMSDDHIFVMGMSNVIAGSDTTAVSLSAMMYYLMRSPEILAKLRGEIEDATAQGRCSARVTFKESQEMPYLQAVMKEALRMHSATGLPLWRVVPEGGAQINGHFFPAGAVVGINTWVAHYDEETFPDAKTFRPERWIEAESDPERLKGMNEMYMPFGLGSRTCIGKHISILEMSKLIPRIIRDFDFTPNAEQWETENAWFVKPVNFTVKVSKRAQAEVGEKVL